VSTQADTASGQLQDLVSSLDYLSTELGDIQSTSDVTNNLAGLVNGVEWVIGNLSAAATDFTSIPEPVSTCDGALLSGDAGSVVSAINSLLSNMATAVPFISSAGVYGIFTQQLTSVQSEAVVFESSLFQLTPDCGVFTSILGDVNSINTLLSSAYSSLSVPYIQPPTPRTTNSCYSATSATCTLSSATSTGGSSSLSTGAASSGSPSSGAQSTGNRKC
jgi:hypothetical protein